jgi:hypothetical protein
MRKADVSNTEQGSMSNMHESTAKLFVSNLSRLSQRSARKSEAEAHVMRDTDWIHSGKIDSNHQDSDSQDLASVGIARKSRNRDSN